MGNTLSEILVSALNPSPRVGMTHSGVFHADDLFSFAILSSIFPSITLIRTRDPQSIAEGVADPLVVVFDIGFQYDPDNRVYDHHQREGKPEPRSNGVPFSSAGLIWRAFGKELIRQDFPNLTGDQVTEVHAGVDLVLMQGIDALDNGDLQGSNVLMSDPDVAVRVMSLAQALSGFNSYGQFASAEEKAADEDLKFVLATPIAQKVLENSIRSSVAFLLAKEAVTEAVKSGIDTGIVVLDKFLPWQEHLFAAEEALGRKGSVKFVLFPQADFGEPTIMVQQVPTEPGAFTGRMPLPEAWAGLRNEQLDAVTGIEGGVFVHAGRFIGGHSTREGAIQMAEAAIASGTAPEPQTE